MATRGVGISILPFLLNTIPSKMALLEITLYLYAGVPSPRTRYDSGGTGGVGRYVVSYYGTAVQKWDTFCSAMRHLRLEAGQSCPIIGQVS